MKIRFIKRWLQYAEGCVIDPHDSVAVEYLKLGVAEPVEKEALETASLGPVSTPTVRARRKRKVVRHHG